MTRQSLYQCCGSLNGGWHLPLFGVRDKNAQIRLMRLAIEKATSSGACYFGRTPSDNRSSEQTMNVMKCVFAQC
jgi:hypothetical protein